MVWDIGNTKGPRMTWSSERGLYERRLSAVPDVRVPLDVLGLRLVDDVSYATRSNDDGLFDIPQV